MPAILIADIEVHDAEAYARYRAANPDVVRQFGGRYLSVGGEVQVIEGDWVPRRVVMIEFPDMATLRAFYSSPEYHAIRGIRWQSAHSRLVAIETSASA